MKKGILLIVILMSLGIGVLVGGFTSNYFLSKFFIDASYISEVADTKVSLKALSHIHNHHIDGAVKTLETDLEAKVMYFENLDDISDSTKNKVNRSLSEIKAYNMKYRPGGDSPGSNQSLQPER